MLPALLLGLMGAMLWVPSGWAGEKKPTLRILRVVDAPDPFSPNQDGWNDTATIHIEIGLVEKFGRRDVLEVTTVLRSSAGERVRTLKTRQALREWFPKKDKEPPAEGEDDEKDRDDKRPPRVLLIEQTWDGRDKAGQLVPDGTYAYTVRARVLTIKKVHERERDRREKDDGDKDDRDDKKGQAEERARATPVEGSITLVAAPPPPLEINPDQARLAPISVSETAPLQTLSSVSFANSVNHEVQQFAGPTGAGGAPGLSVFIDVAAAPGPSGPPNPQICNVQSIANLTPQDLVQWLKTQDADCLNYFLWSYSPSLGATYSNANMTAVLAEIQNAAGQYAGNNAQNLRELMMFVRIGYYHLARQQVVAFSKAQIDPLTVQAVQALTANQNFLANGESPGNLVYETIAAMDTAFLGHHIFSTVKSILSTFLNDLTRLQYYGQQYGLFSTFYLIQRGAKDASFANLVDQDLINKLKAFAVNTNLNANYVWVPNNAAWALGVIYQNINGMKNAALAALTDVVTTQPALTEPYLWAVKGLTRDMDCKLLSNAQTICKSNVVMQLEAQLFTNTYNFDDGAFVVKTPLPLADIQPLYHAQKQVESQFNRITETIPPLNGDPNPVLTMVIYGSLSDYTKYHSFLYNLPTNNGGIYIEQTGTFYTYQRTPQQSTYTLEDLFRHEYVHFLVGRFLIEGLWGQAPIYANDAMVWFDEGLAEFLAWSTDVYGVLPRKSLIVLIQSDGMSRMHVNEIVAATYATGFKFYRYAGTFFLYMYLNDKPLLRSFLLASAASDVAGFNALRAQVSANQPLDAAYQLFLDGLVQNVNGLSNPSTTFPDPTALSTGDLALIQQTFRTSRLGYLGQCGFAAAQANGRFSCRGTLTGQLTNQALWGPAWTAFDAGLNEILLGLKSSNLNNFQGLVCRMGKIRFYASANQLYPSGEYMCDGPIPAQNPMVFQYGAQEQVDFVSTRLGIYTACVNNAGTVSCQTSMSTSLFDNATPYQDMLAFLESDVVDLESDVYAIRPPYYRSLSCTLNPQTVQEIAYNNAQKYLVGTAACTIVH